MTTLLEVRQDSLLSLGDGNTPPQALLRMGIAPVASKWDLFALQGLMFNLHQTAIGTAEAGSAAAGGGIVLTAPTIRFSVPAGTTVFPRHLNISYATAAGNVNEIAWAYTDTSPAATGGVAITPLNWRSDAPRGSVVTNCITGAATPIVEAALTNVRAIYQDIIPLAFAFATNYVLQYTIDKWIDTLIPIVGPAVVLLWMSGATAVTGYYSMDWAEVPTVSAITAV